MPRRTHQQPEHSLARSPYGTLASYHAPLNAWVVEYGVFDDIVPGEWWVSKAYFANKWDAERVSNMIANGRTPRQWMALRDKAIRLAHQQGEFVLYRVMLGHVETFLLGYRRYRRRKAL